MSVCWRGQGALKPYKWRPVNVRFCELMYHILQMQDGPVSSRGGQRVPARLASMTELSLGPPQGSLGPIMEEGSEDCAGAGADEGQSVPYVSLVKDVAKGRKRWASLIYRLTFLPCAGTPWTEIERRT